jgi:AcrR family transcriptional regulator
MKEKILQTAFGLFRRFGIKSISMDAVAQEMCTSKKTIYQSFDNKEKLVEASLEKFLEQLKPEPADVAENSVEELVKTLRKLNQKVAEITSPFFHDLKKYHSKANQTLENYLAEELRPYLIQNLKTGIEQRLYRPEIDPEIVAELCIANFTVVVDHDVFPTPKYNQQEVRLQVFRLFLLGIVTPEGKAFLQVAGDEN